MPLPLNVSSGTVTAQFLDGAGNPRTGSVQFVPATPLLDAGVAIILPASVTATLDATGSIRQALAATNDPDLQPAGWTWQAIPRIDTVTMAPFSFLLLMGTTVDLSSVAMVTASPGGAAGPGIPAGGTVGQVLVKNTGTSYDTSWTTAPLQIAYDVDGVPYLLV